MTTTPDPVGERSSATRRRDDALRSLLVTVRCAARTIVAAAADLEAAMKETTDA